MANEASPRPCCELRVTRRVTLPDPFKCARYRKTPELGPQILFFSGGSALTALSRTLKGYTHNSIHLITPFDSGGSSAKLRQAFAMPSIGDIRSRLMALADESLTGHPEILQLFNHRLPNDLPPGDLYRQLAALAEGNHPLLAAISNPMRSLIRNQLGYFRAAMPAGFDLCGASVGNLILAGGYLNNHHRLDPIIFLFSKLVNVQGTVRALVSGDYHLGAELRDGRCILGQHRLTGKEEPVLDAPIEHLFLNQGLAGYAPTQVPLRNKNSTLIAGADLICYPPGSFYSSLLANLLPSGVGAAIAANGNPKVYIPNLGNDPEQLGMGVTQAITILLHHLTRDAPPDCRPEQVLNFVLLDRHATGYRDLPTAEWLAQRGIVLIDTPLVTPASSPYYDADLLVAALLALT